MSSGSATGLAPLDPDIAQRAFRTALDAFARPGSVQRFPPAPANVPAALLPALALADLDTPACVLGDDDGWAEALATATTAPIRELPAARLVTALRPLQDGELTAVRTGSTAAPEDSAVVALAVPALDGGDPLTLRGPGIATTRTVAPQGLPADLVAVRAAAAFPSGFDLLLVDADGHVLGIPRSTRIDEEN